MNIPTKKIKAYRVLGWVFLTSGIIVYLTNVLYKGLVKQVAFFYPAIFLGLSLIEFAFNIFLWAGLILLWRADKNENPDKKSIWLRLIISYIILSCTALIAAIMMLSYLIRV